MAKFDLFNEKTWAPEMLDMERQITNRALGHIGQMLSSLMVAKEKLLEASFETEEYLIAQELQKKNPTAYAMMGITICYPDKAHADTLSSIDEVFSFWGKGVEHRQSFWRSLIPTLKKLQPYLEKSTAWDRNPIDSEVNKIKIEVKGNAAWDEYLAVKKQIKYLSAAYSKLSESTRVNVEDGEDEDFWDYEQR